MKKAKMMLALIIAATAVSAAYAFKARSFFGYVVDGGVYSIVLIPFNCPAIGEGCIYTSWNNNTFQVYTLSGLRMNPVRP
ncbi:hypothetical protein [Chitinophaga rhizophila]|uniref:Uncharacterized protein n=1 Tax=Chitinophaga rhizophila TaxID=2866212 RepID=A0ABS7G644_9BACT|nr:hypothetical protein [Chitinophaga rhizophila]MBW8683079.1 hypothetical protein [Chitinophaga rhizophila]